MKSGSLGLRLAHEGVQDREERAHLGDQVAYPFRNKRIIAPKTNVHRYLLGAANLHLHFRITYRGKEGVGSHVQDLCAVLHNLVRAGALGERTSPRDEGRAHVGQTGGKDNELPMFIGVVEPTEDAEQVGLMGALRSEVVGLRPLDDCYSVSGHALDGAVETFARLELFLGRNVETVFDVFRDDREERLVLPSRRPDRDREMVEGRPEVVCHISEDHGNVLVKLLRDFEVVPPAATVLLTFRADRADRAICALVDVERNLSVELLEMLFRPIDLEEPGIGHA